MGFGWARRNPVQEFGPVIIERYSSNALCQYGYLSKQDQKRVGLLLVPSNLTPRRMDEIRSHLETMGKHCLLGTHCLLVFRSEPSIQGLLGGAKWISSTRTDLFLGRVQRQVDEWLQPAVKLTMLALAGAGLRVS